MSNRALLFVVAFAATAAAVPSVGAQVRGSSSAAADQGQAITVTVGQQTTLSATGVRNYSVGAGNYVDVRLTQDQSRFVIVGMRAGQTSLLLIMLDGRQVNYAITVNPAAGEEREGEVSQRENIRLDLYFVQLADNYSHNIGIGWPGSIGGSASLTYNAATGTSGQTSLALVANSALPRLDLAQSKGWARIYRQAAVITANGSEASFRSGGEVNIPVAGSVSAEIRQIEFGTVIGVVPRYDSQTGRIELRVTADVSDLTPDRGSGVPGRVVSHLETLVNLELGQSIVLAGLIARTDSRDQTGLPGLSQIPILGALFGTNGRREEENEVLMFIVPSVVDAVPLTERNRIQEAMRIYDRFRGGTEDVELLEQPTVTTPPTAQQP